MTLHLALTPPPFPSLRTSAFLCLLSLLPLHAALFSPTPSTAAPLLSFPHPDRIRYDSHCLQIEGNGTFIFSGAFHYFRTPKPLWRARFQKIKDAGFNCVETYVPWNYHERNAPKSIDDYSQLNLADFDEWMSIAENEFGLHTIIRPGPYICAEWDGGGFPQWLVPLYKPAGWPRDKSWLQTDDRVYLAWAKHWYDAVCRIVAPHQITRKRPGRPGMILFQIENEYERVNWLDKAMKKRQLETLVMIARDGGIDVPIFTCWTSESRGVTDGPLAGVFDCMNFYPRWNIAARMSATVEKERPQQPLAPAMTMELQGGWYSEVGGKLSAAQDGVSSAQTQNITLYALQLGFSLINYYMLVGGTNLDDWASRETTTTYDFNAAIHEHGGVGEKYRLVSAIGAMLHEHGARLARSESVEIETSCADDAVCFAERRARDGSRYIFVRTEDRNASHKGAAHITDKNNGEKIILDYDLEPFGSLIFHLPPDATGASQGAWLPQQTVPAVRRPDHSALPAPVAITTIMRAADPLPQTWTPLAENQTLESLGLVDRHYLYYRIHPAPGARSTVSRIGDRVVNNSRADRVLALANDRFLVPVSEDKSVVTFEAPSDAAEAFLIFENRGLHHHTKPVVEENWRLGIGCITETIGDVTKPLALEYAFTERTRGLQLSTPGCIAEASLGKPAALLTWHRMEFGLPATPANIWVPWQLTLSAKGNGFIYLNGHCIGRFWQAGPQRDFYLPECWLRTGPNEKNSIAISLCPIDEEARIESASIVPLNDFAEYR